MVPCFVKTFARARPLLKNLAMDYLKYLKKEYYKVSNLILNWFLLLVNYFLGVKAVSSRDSFVRLVLLYFSFEI